MKLKRLVALCLFVFLAISLSACTTLDLLLNNNSIEFEDGEALTAKFVSDTREFEGCFVDSDYVVYEGEEVLFLCAFYGEEGIIDYVNDYTDENSEAGAGPILEIGEVNGLKYTIAPYYDEEDDATYHEVVGWIRGSNTGLFGLVFGDEELAHDVLEALTFEIDATLQTNKNYCPDIFDTIENG